jgi:hypothetical protein
MSVTRVNNEERDWNTTEKEKGGKGGGKRQGNLFRSENVPAENKSATTPKRAAKYDIGMRDATKCA